MPTTAPYPLLASYNTWMNRRLYAAAARLDDAALRRDRGAFFGSILGTLNHLARSDRIWLSRFADHFAGRAVLDPLRALPVPDFGAADLFDDFAALTAHRAWLDALIERWIASLDASDLQQVMHYRNSRGDAFDDGIAGLLLHFFNHQTHHRGQATTLLSQAGVDVGVTDLVALVRERAQS